MNDDFINKIIEISNLSNKEHSIFYIFNVENDICHCNILVNNNISGEHIEYGNRDFVFDFEYLKKLIINYNKINNVITKDYILEDNIYTFRIINSNNDCFSISGLSKEKCEDLLKLF